MEWIDAALNRYFNWPVWHWPLTFLLENWNAISYMHYTGGSPCNSTVILHLKFLCNLRSGPKQQQIARRTDGRKASFNNTPPPPIGRVYNNSYVRRMKTVGDGPLSVKWSLWSWSKSSPSRVQLMSSTVGGGKPWSSTLHGSVRLIPTFES